jgi:hypothetical protein
MTWISVKDRLPNDSKETVLALVNNKIMMGYFHARESWNEDLKGVKRNYVKWRYFTPCIWLEDNSCDECETKKSCGNHCISCCEKDYEISLLIPSYGIDVVTYWMPLPKGPDNE